MSTSYHFTITGEITPYVRRTSQGKYSPRARRYHTSQNRMAAQFEKQMQAHGWTLLPADAALEIEIHANVARRITVKDKDNIIKAVLDAAQNVVFPNDRQVYDFTVKMRPGDVDEALVTVYVLDLEV